MYKKHLANAAIAIIKYFLNYDHDISSQLLVIATFILLLTKQFFTSFMTYVKMAKVTVKKFWFLVSDLRKKGKDTDEEQTLPTARHYIKKDILMWQLQH